MKAINIKRLAEAIEGRAKNDLELCNIGGASVLVAQGGDVIYRNHFGFSELSGKPVSDDTLFRLASMTKPITAVAAMILVDRGLLSLEDTVDKFYPSFSSMCVRNGDGSLYPSENKITVRNILTHSSGIGSGNTWVEAAKKLTAYDKAAVENYIEFLSRQPLDFIPGEKQGYSGTGAFSVLTGIIQKITEKTYEDFLKEEIFEPCRMVNTTFLPSAEQWGRIIWMHDKKDGKNAKGNTFEGCVFENVPAENYLGGAGLISSMSDYFNFAAMLLGGGVFEGKRIISENSLKELARPQFFKKDKESWGLGVRVISNDPSNVLPEGSFGWSGAYGTHFWVDPKNKIIGIYMKNSRYDGGSDAVTSENFEIDVCSNLE